MALLSHDDILKLHAAVVSAQLAASREVLLVGIDPGIVVGLPTAANRSDQILHDLGALNEARELADGTIPLAAWLRNAIARAGGKTEGAVFSRALERCDITSTPGHAAPLRPFPGLEFFDEERAADFFGREAQVTEALAQLAEQRPARRWLQIDGPSGAGKSSFARAGIVPAVRAGKVVGGPKVWTTAVMRPGYDPITSLAEALVKHAKPTFDVKGSLDAVTQELSSSTTALKSFLREHAPEESGVLLLVDQFEETFTLAHADETGVKQFDALLAAALDDVEGPLVLVTTIRSDFVVRMGELPSLEEKLPTQAVRYYLRPMDEAGLHAAIEKPAERAGLACEDGLVDRIVADAITSRGALPLVAHVLEALYARREGRRLTTRAYDLVGGVAGALPKSADAIIDSLEAEERARARRLLLRLVKIGRGNEDTRQTATRDAAVGAAGGGPEAERVLARLSGGRAVGVGGADAVSGRLVVVSSEAGTERVDLAHEALIQRWRTLRTWIKDTRNELELRDDVEEAARIWTASGSAVDSLPKGPLLARFQSAEIDGLEDVARDYLLASAASERRVQEGRRRLRFFASGSLVICVAIVTMVLYVSRRHRDSLASANAEADIYRLCNNSEAYAKKDRTLSLLLAVEAWRRSHSDRGAVISTPGNDDAMQVLSNLLQPDAAIDAFVGGRNMSRLLGLYSAVGRSHIMLVSEDGGAQVWDVITQRLIHTLRGHSKLIRRARYDEQDRRLLTASSDKTARIWKIDANGDISEASTILAGHEDEVLDIGSSSDGRRVATASADKTVRIWDSTGATRQILRGHLAAVTSVCFSPDGKRLLTASLDQTVRLWDAETGDLVRSMNDHFGVVVSAEFASDSKTILTASADKTVRLWKSDDASPPIIARFESPLVSAAFTRDGKRFVAASSDGAVHLERSASDGHRIVLRRASGILSSMTFKAVGKEMLALGDEGRFFRWTIDDTILKEAACDEAKRPLTRDEWARWIGTFTYRPTCHQ